MGSMTTAPRMTNSDFGRRVGCSHSMASRIRSGNRLPGLDLMNRISAEFDIPVKTMMKARQEGPEAMAALLERRVKAPKTVAA